MPGIGTPGLIVILLALLLLFGPKKLPELGRSIGKTIHEFKNAAKDLTESADMTEENS